MDTLTLDMPKPTREGVRRKASTTQGFGPQIMTGQRTADGVVIRMDARAWIALAMLILSVIVTFGTTIAYFHIRFGSMEIKMTRVEVKIEGLERQGLRNEDTLDSMRPPYSQNTP